MLKTGSQKEKNGKKCRLAKLIDNFLTQEACKSFQELKNAFLELVMLQHFNPLRKTCIETNASGSAISGILS